MTIEIALTFSVQWTSFWCPDPVFTSGNSLNTDTTHEGREKRKELILKRENSLQIIYKITDKTGTRLD